MGVNDALEVFKDTIGQYRWRLKSSSGETVATSEAYESKQAAIASAHRLHELSSNTPVKDLTL